MPFLTWSTGMDVALARSDGRRLSCSGAKCCTSTNAMPVSLGKLLRKSVKASSPPAEAPTPTTGNDFLDKETDEDASSEPSRLLPAGRAMPWFVPGAAADLRLLLGGVRILLAFSGFIQFLRDRHPAVARTTWMRFRRLARRILRPPRRASRAVAPSRAAAG